MLQRLLPALIPSWRFFDRVGPALRIEYAWLPGAGAVAEHWEPFRPEPERVPMPVALLRLVWDPRGNHSLYLLSCAERLLETGSGHAEHEIRDAILADLQASRSESRTGTAWLAFRIRWLEREGDALSDHIGFQSQAVRIEAA